MFIGGDGGGKAESDRKRERQNSGKDYLLAQAKNLLAQAKNLQAENKNQAKLKPNSSKTE